MNTKRTLLLIAVIHPLSVLAQDSTIESHVISGGGGTSSGGGYTISGTIGQPAAGALSAGEHVLHGGFWGTSLQVIVEPDESFESWMDSLVGGDKPPEGQRGPLDIAAGDGMTNLLKYALGLMPMTPSADAAPKLIAVTATNGGVEQSYLAIELERSKDAAVNFQLEASDDLEGWEDATFVTDVLNPDVGDNRERIRLLSGIALNEHPEFFLRLRISMP